jgi:hypothetical protein
MKQPEDLKVTKLCEMCQFQYGRWRQQCPGCGHKNEHQPAPVGEKPRPKPVLARKTRDRRADECIFCYRRKARQRCPHCNESIHPVCRGLHEGPCAAFQIERNKALDALGVKR